VMWGRKRKVRPKEYFVFGTIQEADRIIRIHPRSAVRSTLVFGIRSLSRNAAFSGSRRDRHRWASARPHE
jgi:hypothetical protein